MSKRSATNFRVFMVYMNPTYKNQDATGQKILERKITEWCDDHQIKRVAMVCVPSPVDSETCGIYKINPAAKNTVFVYKKRLIVDKLVNVEYSNEELNSLLKKLDDALL